MNKADKGKEGGSCNRGRCQCAPARWYSHGSYSWYCDDCRQQIEFDPINRADWQLNFYPRLLHPMFETREMMDDRKEATEMIDKAEENIRADYRIGKITKEQFQKEMLIMARARKQALNP